MCLKPLSVYSYQVVSLLFFRFILFFVFNLKKNNFKGNPKLGYDIYDEF
jgi:hypothetical protein